MSDRADIIGAACARRLLRFIDFAILHFRRLPALIFIISLIREPQHTIEKIPNEF